MSDLKLLLDRVREAKGPDGDLFWDMFDAIGVTYAQRRAVAIHIRTESWLDAAFALAKETSPDENTFKRIAEEGVRSWLATWDADPTATMASSFPLHVLAALLSAKLQHGGGET